MFSGLIAVVLTVGGYAFMPHELGLTIQAGRDMAETRFRGKLLTMSLISLPSNIWEVPPPPPQFHSKVPPHPIPKYPTTPQFHSKAPRPTQFHSKVQSLSLPFQN
jgi:hypothetical protein